MENSLNKSNITLRIAQKTELNKFIKKINDPEIKKELRSMILNLKSPPTRPMAISKSCTCCRRIVRELLKCLI